MNRGRESQLLAEILELRNWKSDCHEVLSSTLENNTKAMAENNILKGALKMKKWEKALYFMSVLSMPTVIILLLILLFGSAGCTSGNDRVGFGTADSVVTKCEPVETIALLSLLIPGEWEELPSWAGCEPIFSIGQPWGDYLPEGACPSPNGPQIIYEYTLPGDSIPCVIFAWNVRLKKPGRPWLLRTDWP
jgi:hypothetical protein